MLAAKLEGSIVNVGSIGAQAALGDSPASAYSMAKAGHALTRNLAIELASAGIRVNAVSPWDCSYADIRRLHGQSGYRRCYEVAERFPPAGTRRNCRRCGKHYSLPVV